MKNHPRHIEWIPVIAILVLAAVLRVGWLGVSTFALDEARISVSALNMVRRGELIRLGTFSSVGIPFFPAGTWIFGLPYLFTSDPLIATVFVSLVNIVAIAALWRLARANWEALPSLAAMGFFAVAPYGVIYSRNIWQPDFLAPLAVAWAWAIYLARTHRKSKLWVGITIFLTGFTIQVHFAGIALGLAVVYLFFRYHWWKFWQPIGIAILLNLIIASPYFYELMIASPTLQDTYRDAFHQPAVINTDSLKNLRDITLSTGTHELLVGKKDTSYNSLIVYGTVLLLGLGLLAILADRIARKSIHTASTFNLSEIALVWFVASPLFFLRHTTPVNPYYQLIALPAAALVVGASLRLVRHWWWQATLGTLILIVVLASVVDVGHNLSIAEREGTPFGLSIPLKWTRKAAYELDDAPVLFFTNGGNPDYDGNAAIFEIYWWGRPKNRIVNGNAILILPTEKSYLLSELAPIQAWEEVVASGLAHDIGTFQRRTGEPNFVWTAYDGQQEPEGFIAIEPPISFSDGTQLEGWRVRWVGPRLRISTLWRAVGPLPKFSDNSQQFNHLRTADMLENQPFTISDVPLTIQQWHEGDRVIVIADFFVEEQETFWVDVGHYWLERPGRALREDGQGDFVRIGPFDTSALP